VVEQGLRTMSGSLDIVLLLMDPKQDHRAVIRDAWNSDNEEFFIGLDMAINPSLEFGLAKVPGLPDDDFEPGTLSFSAFYNLAMTLANQHPTNGADLVEEAALTANAQEWNLWYRRILLKSLHKHLPMEVIQSELIRLTTEQ